MGVITWIPSKYEQVWCFCPLSSACSGRNMGKVLGAFLASAFLSLVCLLTSVPVLRASLQADECSQVCLGFSSIFGSGFEIPFCPWALFLLSPPLLHAGLWDLVSWNQLFCSWNELLKVPEMVPVLSWRCQQWPWSPTLVPERWNLCLEILCSCPGGTFSLAWQLLSSARCAGAGVGRGFVWAWWWLFFALSQYHFWGVVPTAKPTADNERVICVPLKQAVDLSVSSFPFLGYAMLLVKYASAGRSN